MPASDTQVTFYCPNCGNRLKAQEKLIGKTVCCTDCFHAVAVPAESVSASAKPAPKGYIFAAPRPKATFDEVLRSAVEKANKLGLKPFAYFYGDWCAACKKLRDAMTDSRMIEAFRGTYVVLFPEREWSADAGIRGFDYRAIPVFFRLDANGRPVGKIDGGAWKENIPENMAGPLRTFFHGAQPIPAPVKPEPVVAKPRRKPEKPSPSSVFEGDDIDEILRKPEPPPAKFVPPKPVVVDDPMEDPAPAQSAASSSPIDAPAPKIVEPPPRVSIDDPIEDDSMTDDTSPQTSGSTDETVTPPAKFTPSRAPVVDDPMDENDVFTPMPMTGPSEAPPFVDPVHEGHSWSKPADASLSVRPQEPAQHYPPLLARVGMPRVPQLPPRAVGGVPASWHFSRPGSWIDPDFDLADIALDIVTPDVIRTNPFRVTGVSVETAERDVLKQIEKRRLMAEYGGGSTMPSGLFSSAELPDEDQLRDARMRLGDPPRRIFDELFWFWPIRPGRGGEDEALAKLAAGDTFTTVALWQEENGPDGADRNAGHNFAVLFLFLALEWEYLSHSRGEPLSGSEESARDDAWLNAFRYWRLLIDDDVFWDLLKRRVEGLRDARLKPDSLIKLRREFPRLLLAVPAQLAIHAAEAGNKDTAERFVRLMRDSQFEERDIDSVLRWAVEPIRDRLHTLGKAALDAADADAGCGDRECDRLLEQSRPLLAIVEMLLPGNDPVVEGVHDDVALNGLTCQIRYGNATKKWARCVELIDAILSLAQGSAARDRINENAKIIRDNARFAPAENALKKCWFCHRGDPDNKAECEVKMHGNLTKEHIYNGFRLRWTKLSVKVPRCKTCKEAHKRFSMIVGISAGVGAMIGAAFAFFNSQISNDNTPPIGYIVMGAIAAAVLGLIGAGLGAIIGYFFQPKGVAFQGAKNKFPHVLQNRYEGWKFGENPNQNAWPFTVKDPQYVPRCSTCNFSYGMKKGRCTACETFDKIAETAAGPS